MKKAAFWITNTSNRNVSLGDLNLTVKAYSSVNLLDDKHYHYNIEQLKLSALSGSLFKKKHLISIRKVPPVFTRIDIPIKTDSYIPSRERSNVEIKEENYEELNISDEQFAEQNSDLIEN